MSSVTYVNREDVNATDNCHTAVAWGAIIGGAFTAAAASLVLLLLGSALGLSTISPWSSGQTIGEFTAKAAIWLIVMQWIASGLGGYLAGRLRSKWSNMHNDEVFFRDTAHGFLAWAVATVLTSSLLASTAASVVKTGAEATAAVAAGAAAGASQGAAQNADNFEGDIGYYIDSLFRSNTPATNTAGDMNDVRAETAGIIMMSIKNGSISAADRDYVANVISSRSSITYDEAVTRVDAVIAQLNTAKEELKQKAEQARKVAMRVSTFIFLSLLIGAFIASSAAALGGRHRDEF